MPTGLYTRWKLDSESQNFKPRQSQTRSFENKDLSYFQRVRPQCELENFYTTGAEKEKMPTVLIVFGDTGTMCLKLWGVIIIIAHVNKLALFSLRKECREAIKTES